MLLNNSMETLVFDGCSANVNFLNKTRMASQNLPNLFRKIERLILF